MNTQQLEYYSYLLANDLINNKLESSDILDGSFIPEFNLHNNEIIKMIVKGLILSIAIVIIQKIVT